MAFTPATLSLHQTLIGGKYRFWTYLTTDNFGDVDATDYFALVYDRGVREGDTIWIIETNDDPPTVTQAVFSALDADGNGTVTAVTQSGNVTVEDLTVNGNSIIGSAVTDTVGFYGVTPTAQLANAAQSAVPTTAITTAVSTLVTGTFGFVTSTQGDAVVAAVNSLIARVAANTVLVNRLRDDLVSIGIIKGAA